MKIGAYVSGGIDSSSIASIANEYCESDLVDLQDFFLDMVKAMMKLNMLTYYQLKIIELFNSEIKPNDFVDNIEKVIYHLDTPIAGPGAFLNI